LNSFKRKKENKLLGNSKREEKREEGKQKNQKKSGYPLKIFFSLSFLLGEQSER